MAISYFVNHLIKFIRALTGDERAEEVEESYRDNNNRVRAAFYDEIKGYCPYGEMHRREEETRKPKLAKIEKDIKDLPKNWNGESGIAI